MSNLASFPAQSFPSCLRFVVSTEHAIFSLSLEGLNPLVPFCFFALGSQEARDEVCWIQDLLFFHAGDLHTMSMEKLDFSTP